jgi:hypothetical protein
VLLVGNGSLSGVWVMGVLLRSLRIILPTDARALGQSRARADVGHLPHCVRPMRGTVSGAAVNFHAVCAVDIRARPPARHTRPPKRAAACRFRKLDSRVSMMEPTKDRVCNNISEPLDRACAGRVLPERNMSSYVIIIGDVFR